MDTLLRESGFTYDRINYYIAPLSENKLRNLLKKMKISPRDLLRTRDPIYRELKLADNNPSEEELITLMLKHPDLIQRPILESGERAVLGRPIDNVKDFLSDLA